MTYYYDCGNEEVNIATTALIDRLTFNRITDKGFDNLTAFQKERITKAAQLQSAYYIQNGIDTNTSEDNIASISVEDFSVSYNANSIDTSYANKPYKTSSAAYNLLVQTGLCCRAI